MKPTSPEPPILEMGFYFSSVVDADALALLINELLRVGARFTGEVLAFAEDGAREKAFASYTDLSPDKREYREISLPYLKRLMTDPGVRLLRVGMADAIGLAPREIVTYSHILPESTGIDVHPVTILTEGGAFSESQRRTGDKTKRLGKKVYEYFLALVSALHPAYAAITIEYALECPTDLRYDVRSYAFRDFYVSGKYIGESDLSKINDICKRSYLDAVGDGLYISSYAPFNPRHEDLPVEIAISNSVKVAGIIAKHSSLSGNP